MDQPKGPDSAQDQQGTDIVDSSLAASEITSEHQTHFTLPAYAEKELDTSASAFGRYRNLTFVGKGAMAKVYKADDPTLGRTVALKFIRGDDPQLVKRLMMEAHSHAKVEHKHVCKIYEVGETEGRPYIAMQYINGRTLKDVMPELNIEKKVKLMKEVAEAIHETHRVGVIHRDLKPTNILVVRNDEGELIPYVMDFGIARVSESEGLTMTGMVIGTPWYMSPEQALGKAREVDRRSDVYSLGATLYQLLTESLPFDASENTAQALAKVIQDEPVPLRKRKSSLPVDLETIVMKCLEKEPERRYDSARALAEELQRYLDGESILARPTSFVYRIYRKSQKHKTLAAVIFIATLTILLMAEIAFNTWRTSKQQAYYAQQFGQEISKIEETIRIGRVYPLHDMQREKQKVRMQMQKIEKQINQMSKAATGPGHYSLGRAYLSLEEYEKARDQLQVAWDEGYREPAVAYSLGLALGEIYRQKLFEVERIRNAERKEQQRKKIEAEYRNPALNFLHQGAQSGAQPDYVEALIHYYEQDWVNALKKSNEARKKEPELYEVDLLQGDVYLSQGTKHRVDGNNKEAHRYFSLAREIFSEAMKVGRSDARAYDGLCRTWYQVIYTTFYASGGDLRPQIQNALTDCSNALKADSQRSDVMASQLSIYSLYGEFLMVNGEDPRTQFQTAIQLGKKAISIDPKNGQAYLSVGLANMNLGDYELNHGINPVASYEESIRNYKAAIENIREPDYGYAQLASALQSLGSYEMYKGKDATPTLTQAIENYERALKISPSAAYYNNLAITNYNLGFFKWKTGNDPTPWFTKSEEAYRQAIRSNPTLIFPHNNLGHVLVTQAEYGIRTGKDPQKLVTTAMESFDLARKMNPNYFNSYWDSAIAYRILDEYELVNGRKPSHYKQIETYLQKAEELRPDLYFVYYEKAMAHLQTARSQFAERKSPERELDLAKQSLGEAIKRNPEDNDVYVALANCWKVGAQWKHLNKQDFMHEITQGMSATDKAIANFAKSANAYVIRGVLLTLKASKENEPAQKRHGYNLAAQQFEKALAIDSYMLPEDKPFWIEVTSFSPQRPNK